MTESLLTDEPKADFWTDIAADLRANGWDNEKLGTALRIIFLELSFQTLLLYRIQRVLDQIPYVGTTLRRVVAWMSGIITSCEISALAEIEGGVTLPHAKGVVIGKGCVVRRGATIYQHVTLGTKFGHGAEEAYPVVECGAKLYVGSVIVGGVTIGKNATVGANAVVLTDVPEGKTAVGIPARVL